MIINIFCFVLCSINGITQEKEDSNQDSDDENLQSESPDDAIEGNNNIEHKSNSNAINMKLASTQRKDESANSSLETSPSGAKAIKARGTYYPLTAFPTSMPQGPVMRKGDESPPRHETVPGRKYHYVISSFRFNICYALSVKIIEGLDYILHLKTMITTVKHIFSKYMKN